MVTWTFEMLVTVQGMLRYRRDLTAGMRHRLTRLEHYLLRRDDRDRQ